MKETHPSAFTDADKKMLYDVCAILPEVVKRIDRHSAEHQTAFERIWNELKEIKESIHSENTSISKKFEANAIAITKLETERNLGMKILVPIIAALVSLITSWLSNKPHS
jgi:hypothetical protein